MLFRKLMRKQRKQQPVTGPIFSSDDLWITDGVALYDGNENFFSFVIGAIYAHKCGDWGRARKSEMDNKLRSNLQVESIFDIPADLRGFIPFEQIRVVTDSHRTMTSVWAIEPCQKGLPVGEAAA